MAFRLMSNDTLVVQLKNDVIFQSLNKENIGEIHLEIPALCLYEEIFSGNNRFDSFFLFFQ